MTTSDKRANLAKPVARIEFATLTFPAEDTAALTATVGVNGTIKAIEIDISETEDNITYTVALTTTAGASVFSEAALADLTSHWRDAESNKGTPDADFNAIPMADETLTATITPSTKPDAGTVGTKTATVTVKLYVV